MNSTVKNIKIYFKRREVRAKKLTVNVILPIDIETAWAKAKTCEVLEYITKGKVKFKPVNGRFPRFWKEGQTLRANMLLYRCIPFGGIRTLYFKKIDSKRYTLQTREKDSMAKVWNHKISMVKIDDGQTEYKDEIIIYGGIFTNIIAWWAKSFCEYRQKRWLEIVNENLLWSS